MSELNIKLTEEEKAQANSMAAQGIRLATEWVEACHGEMDMVVMSHAASYLMALLLVSMDNITTVGDMRMGRFITEHDRLIHHVKSVTFYADFIRSQQGPQTGSVQ